MRSVTLAGALAAALAAPGCFWVTTKHEGRELRQDVGGLEDRMTQTEDALGTKVQQLEKVLEEATKLLARNSADLGAEVSGLVQEQATLTGLVMEAKRYVDQIREELTARERMLEERVNAIELRLASLEKTPAKSPAELYADGKAAFDAKDWDRALELMRQMVLNHPNHSLAASAQHHRAEAFYQKKDFKAAIGEFQRVFERFPKSDLAPEALFRAGEAAQELKWCTDARAYFGLLRQKYPRSPLARKAQAKDADLRKWAKDKKRCQS
jgi:tol-pal system protein YbgF